MWNVRLADFDHVLVQAAVEEKARVAKEKELETARLRAKQEKAADRQAEIDELRARRYASVCAPTENFLHAWQVLDSHCFWKCSLKMHQVSCMKSLYTCTDACCQQQLQPCS